MQIGSGPLISLGTVMYDTRAMAAAINNGRVAGLSASNGPAVVAGVASSAAATAAGSATLTLNGVPITLAGGTGGAALAGNRAAAVAAINARSATTGVVADDSGGTVNLTAADGRNIETTYAAGSFSGSSEADFGLAAAGVRGGTLNTYYTQPAGVTGDAVFFNGGAPSYTYVVTTGGPSVAALDIASTAGATSALASVDRAMASVTATRASLGALQSRFASTVDTLASTWETLSASRSRIQDADFAVETANFSRAQVLQQAGTAMIAQANQLPARVLSLLKAG